MLLLKHSIAHLKAHQQIARFKKYYQIRPKKRLFDGYYQDSNGFLLSKSARANNTDSSLLYGEIVFESFASCLTLISPTPEDVFYDLGSGTGKACITAAMVFKLSHITGIERLSTLYKESLRIKEKIPDALQKKVIFKHEDFNLTDFSPATIVFINATGFFGEIWDNIVQLLINYLKPGARLIVTSKTLPPHHFHLIRKTRCLMSWGAAHIHLYYKN